MRRGRTLPAALLLALGIAAGGLGAGFLRHMSSADENVCFGHALSVSTRSYTVSARGAENARRAGHTLRAGERRQARVCRLSPVESITLDAASGVVLGHDYAIADAETYYRQHPDERPSTQLQRLASDAAQAQFVAPGAAALRSLRQPSVCDPGWPTYESLAKGLRVCHPAGWRLDDSIAHRLLLTSANVTLNIHAVDASAALDCAQPSRVTRGGGEVQVCAVQPQEGGQSHHLLLPNGIVLFLFVTDGATQAQRDEAFRVAVSVGRPS